MQIIITTRDGLTVDTVYYDQADADGFSPLRTFADWDEIMGVE